MPADMAGSSGARHEPTLQQLATWAQRKRPVHLDNGQVAAVVELGEGAATPLLLLHGVTDSSLSFCGLAPLLSDRRVIVPDLRGHGASGRPDRDFAISDFVEDARQVLAHLGIERADIAGHSLGGIIAQAFAESYPEATQRLVLIGTSATAERANGGMHAELDALDVLEADGDFLRRWYANPSDVPEQFLAMLRQDASTIPAGTVRKILSEVAMAQRGDRRTIQKPALVVWGREDPLFDFTHQQTLLARLAQATFAPLAGHGHNPFWESPGKVAGLIRQFLDQ